MTTLSICLTLSKFSTLLNPGLNTVTALNNIYTCLCAEDSVFLCMCLGFGNPERNDIQRKSPGSLQVKKERVIGIELMED